MNDPSLSPGPCCVELLFRHRAALDRAALAAALAPDLGRTTVEEGPRGGLVLVLEDFQSLGPEGPVRVSLDILGRKTRPDRQTAEDALAASLDQTWMWDAAGDAADQADQVLRVMDEGSSAMEPKSRMELWNRLLHVLVMDEDCLALHFPLSQCLVDPEEYRRHVPGAEDSFPLLGLVNVRLYRVAGAEDEILMDTLGLNVFGLPDAQCHCTGVEPDALAEWLFSLALVLADQGTIGDGDRVRGVDGKPLVMTREKSLVGPPRVVVDLQSAEDG